MVLHSATHYGAVPTHIHIHTKCRERPILLGSHLIANPVLTGDKEDFTVKQIDSLLVNGIAKLHNAIIELLRLTDTALQAAVGCVHT